MTIDDFARMHTDLATSAELEIAAVRDDGSFTRYVPIWFVPGPEEGGQTGGRLYVRTWYRKDRGWHHHAVASGRARIRLHGNVFDVEVTDVATDPSIRREVDAAYRRKYEHAAGSSVGRMLADDAVQTTLELRVNGSAA